MSKDNPLNIVLPPRPGVRPPADAPSGREVPISPPSESPHLKEGDEPVWMTCRANEACGGKYAVQVMGGERGLQAGGGSWLRYRCLTCGGAFHISR